MSQFTCPKCGSHRFGSTNRDGKLMRLCNGSFPDFKRCNFSWPSSDDALYGLEKPTGGGVGTVQMNPRARLDQL